MGGEGGFGSGPTLVACFVGNPKGAGGRGEALVLQAGSGDEVAVFGADHPLRDDPRQDEVRMPPRARRRG